jgi:hypothetical protein
MSLEWDNAKDALKELIKSEFEHSGFASLQLACATFMSGDKENSIILLEEVSHHTKKKSRFDDLSLRKSKELLNNENQEVMFYLVSFELLFFRRDIAHMKKEQLEEVQKNMEDFNKKLDFEKIKKPTANDFYLYIGTNVLLASMLNNLGYKKESIELFEKTIQVEKKIPKNSNHW